MSQTEPTIKVIFFYGKEKSLFMSINTEIGRKYDYFKGLVVPRACYFIVRLDGNCFSKLTKKFERPFDEKFHKTMVAGTKKLMTYIPDIYKAHFHSDEISLYFSKDSEWFDRRIQKITSITAGILSAKFSIEISDEAHFDSRILVTPTKKDVEEYEKDRRLNAWRGCINSYAYYKLRQSGLTARQATKKLFPMKSNDRQELLFSEFEINISKVPAWQRVGDFMVWEDYEKEGYNPIKKIKEMAKRRRIVFTKRV